MPERTVAIVGRPNVGKSALFNRLARRRIAIVHDMPGVTRDRIHAECTFGSDPFTIVDTGGIGGSVDLDFSGQVKAEVDIAIETAQVILFVVDGQQGITPVDAELARKLRKTTKPLILVINKIDVPQHYVNASEFDRLGFSDSLAISAEHDRGIADLVAEIESKLPAPEPREDAGKKPMKITLVGRPNVGKSSLTNAILRDERTLVSPIAGTTRDAVDIPYERGSKRYVLIDTAGIRHRTKVSHSVEVFSVMRSEKSIVRADLCCLVIDAEQGVTAMDKKIAGMVREANKPCVVAVNKWDLVTEKTRGKGELKAFIDEIHAGLVAVNYAPFVMCCAKDHVDITRLFKTIEKVRTSAQHHLGTGALNRIIQTAMSAAPPPTRHGKRFKVLYATHPDHSPNDIVPVPEVVLFCNDARTLDESYRRYLEGQIRKVEPFEGLPLLMRLRPREQKESAGKR
ncbi:MAG TPA: ribosome biogenesis GTPase Der [Chthoniobacteraceae bacterium]|nr:ribosome biogenesis GTPase Der [Chthoniobacteraceae bacterium]